MNNLTTWNKERRTYFKVKHRIYRVLTPSLPEIGSEGLWSFQFYMLIYLPAVALGIPKGDVCVEKRSKKILTFGNEKKNKHFFFFSLAYSYLCMQNQ